MLSTPSWFTPARLGRALQFVFLGFTLWTGWRFYAFCQWVQGHGPMAARPAGVEGFLPISALLGFKNFFITGQYDPVHPAGLTILLAALGIALLLRKGFCGYICPVGLVSNLLARAGRRLGVQHQAAGRANSVLRLLKYPLLGFFVFTILVSMSGPAIRQFLTSPYNLTADARLLQFFQNPSATSLAVFGALGVLSLVVKNPWCRFLCPYGALLGLFAWAGPTAVRRDENACTQCGKCQRACPAAIPVQEKTVVRTPECLGCGRCVGACGKQGAVRAAFLGRPMHWAALGLGTAAVFALAWGVAKATGYWDSQLPAHMLKGLYARAFGSV